MKEENIIYERVRAQVKFYDRAKGFGFAKRPNKNDVFISQKALEESGIQHVRENDWILFDLVPTKNGKSKAIRIKQEGK